MLVSFPVTFETRVGGCGVTHNAVRHQDQHEVSGCFLTRGGHPVGAVEASVSTGGGAKEHVEEEALLQPEDPPWTLSEEGELRPPHGLRRRAAGGEQEEQRARVRCYTMLSTKAS